MGSIEDLYRRQQTQLAWFWTLKYHVRVDLSLSTLRGMKQGRKMVCARKIHWVCGVVQITACQNFFELRPRLKQPPQLLFETADFRFREGLVPHRSYPKWAPETYGTCSQGLILHHIQRRTFNSQASRFSVVLKKWPANFVHLFSSFLVEFATWSQ